IAAPHGPPPLRRVFTCYHGQVGAATALPNCCICSEQFMARLRHFIMLLYGSLSSVFCLAPTLHSIEPCRIPAGDTSVLDGSNEVKSIMVRRSNAMGFAALNPSCGLCGVSESAVTCACA